MSIFSRVGTLSCYVTNEYRNLVRTTLVISYSSYSTPSCPLSVQPNKSATSSIDSISFEEKITRSTVNSKNNGLKKPVSAEIYPQKSELTVTEEIEGKIKLKSQSSSQKSFPQAEKVNLDNETATIDGICEGKTEKALLILFDSGKQIWIPKSTIRSEFDQDSSNTQQFTIDTWVLKKNEVIKSELKRLNMF